MTCAKASELLAAFADGGLEGNERDEVAAHVRGCDACSEEVRVLREVLADTRRLAAPDAHTTKDEAFWLDLARDIRVAVAESRPTIPWWRLPAISAAFAMAAAAVLWVYLKGQASVVGPVAPVAPVAAERKAAHAPPPLPPTYDIDDLDADQLAAVNAALSPSRADDDDPPEDELAVASPAVAENLVENLDDTDLARVATAL